MICLISHPFIIDHNKKFRAGSDMKIYNVSMFLCFYPSERIEEVSLDTKMLMEMNMH